MAEERKQNYGNESISALKGADRVRKRPGVIFGSDGLEGCEHAVFFSVKSCSFVWKSRPKSDVFVRSLS